MREYLKKMIYLTLLFVICFFSVVDASIDLTTFNAKIEAFKTQKYNHGSIYQDNPELTGGYTCFGFANEVALYVWGSYPTKSMSAASVNSGWSVTYGGSAVDTLCVGDIVRYHYHSIFITGISGDTIYYCQANTPSGTNKVTFDNTVSRSSLKSKVSDQLTSPGTTKTGWVAHYIDGLSSYNPSVPEAPTNAWINSSRISATTDDNVTLSWGADGATEYWLHIYKDGQDFVNQSMGSGTSLIRRFPAGNYVAYIEASNSGGSKLVSVSFSIVESTPPDTEAPTISDFKVTNLSGESFVVECNLNDNVGVTRVWLNVWGPNGSFKGYEVSASNGTFSHKINTSDYGGAGYYTVHISAFDAVWNESAQAKRSDIYAYTDTEAPTINNLKATNISGDSFTIECDLNDNVGVTRVWLNIYGPDSSKNNGFGVSASNGKLSYTINTSDYGGVGTYEVHVYAFDNKDNQTGANISNIGAWINLGDKFYAYIENQSTGKFLTNEDGNVEGADKNGIGSQIWEFTKCTDGSYRIYNEYDNTYMDVLNADTTNNNNVQCWQDYGLESLSQKFFIDYKYDAYFIRIALNPSKCLDMNLDSNNVTIWDGINDTPQRKFNIIKIDNRPPDNLGDEFYAYIENSATAKYLTNIDRNAVGATKNTLGTQVWRFKRCDDGAYIIYNDYDNTCLELSNGSIENNNNVQCWEYYGYENSSQKFYIYHKYGAYYITSILDSSKCFDMNLDSNNITIWDGTNDTPQRKFNIIKIDSFYKIIYDSEDCENVPYSQYKINNESLIITSEIPLRKGYHFKSWNTCKNGSGHEYLPGMTYEANESVTLYAQWEKSDSFVESVVTANGSSFSVSSYVYNIEEASKILVAGFKGNSLVDVAQTTQGIPAVLEGNIDLIKIMVWNNHFGLMPLSDSQTIPSSEFIFE